MMYDKWWKNAGTCNRDDKKESKANSLGVDNVGGIFVVLLVGLALAVFVAMAEFTVNSRKNRRPGQEKVSQLSIPFQLPNRTQWKGAGGVAGPLISLKDVFQLKRRFFFWNLPKRR